MEKVFNPRLKFFKFSCVLIFFTSHMSYTQNINVLHQYEIDEQHKLFLVPETDNVYLSYEVYSFLNEVLDLLQSKSLHSEMIDWDTFKKELFFSCNYSMYDSQTYSGIKKCLFKLQEKKPHSRFIPKKAEQYKKEARKRDNKTKKLILGKLIDSKIAYLNIPPINSMDYEYVKFIQDQVKFLNSSGATKWVIDLRGNHGGNCWPMLLALGPFWNETTLGFFGDNENGYQSWFYEKGCIGLEKNNAYMQHAEFYNLKENNPYIAILIGEKTASSGEVVAVAFQGQKNVKSFGKHTAGYTTGVASYTLSNDTRLCIAGTFFYDRNKRLYDCGIAPDQEVIDDDEKDTTLETAISWLRSFD